eukprot:TRINITY_DN5474_c0_g1_i3.p1 TRINITY_DN5474_c0_g1~~TRINITY_DN5474_c0_g1_i3.p1  ORF type:complete len:168 (+),score=35.47 TRINITY_DN5474_c0_g1_i3:449-952(+)
MAKQNAKQDKRVEINNRCIEVVKLLISYLLKKQNMDISMKYKHFTWACSNGIASIVKQFLDDQAVDPTVNDNEALRNACTNGITEVVKVLLADPRVDPSYPRNVCLRRAAANGHAEIVSLLIEDPRVDPTSNNNEAFECSKANGYPEVVRILQKVLRLTSEESQEVR